MKTREELITEMAAEITAQWGITSRCKQSCMECVGYSSCSLGHAAAGAIDVGYRKQSDTVREFVERVKEVYDKEFYHRLGGYDIFDLWSDIIHLAAEYGVEVKK